MNIAHLIAALPVTLHRGIPATVIEGITDDSRQVRPGWLFIARPGHDTDGRKFIDDAVARGAAAVLVSDPANDPGKGAVLVSGDIAATTLALLNRFHGRPGEALRLIGITGTNGKTTTSYLIRHLLNAADRRCGLIGTVEIDDGVTCRPSELTTPGIVQMFALLADMVRHGCDACVMEVSSHALDQGRARGLNFGAAVFTNLTGDHLDYHGTMEAYGDAKAKLFESLDDRAAAIVNTDDPAHERMLRACPARQITFSPSGGGADCRAEVVDASARYTDCRLIGPWGEIRSRLPLIGLHNVANVLGAVAAAHAIGVDVSGLTEALDQCPQTPGRLERVAVQPEQPFDVLVDYAHTDDALANVLTALRPVTHGRLRVLFGCGGDRDKSKRPRMAAIACRLADDIVITSDNPRTEDPQAIIRDILTGVTDADQRRVQTEPDRAAAIGRIIADAQPGDVVLLAGKGHEDYQIIGTQKRPFDDREAAREAIESLDAAVR